MAMVDDHTLSVRTSKSVESLRASETCVGYTLEILYVSALRSTQVASKLQEKTRATTFREAFTSPTQ